MSEAANVDRRFQFDSRLREIEERISGMEKDEKAPPLTGGTGGTGSMDGRIAKIESDISHIQNDIKEVKSDLRRLLIAGLVATLLALGAVGTSYMSLSKDINKISSDMNNLPLRILEVQKLGKADSK